MSSDLASIRKAHKKLARARTDFEQEVRAAHASGASLRSIAAAAGLSHQRVHQIVRAH